MKWIIILFALVLAPVAFAQESVVEIPDLLGQALPFFELALKVIGGLVSAATAVALFTKNTDDDAKVGVVKLLLDRLSLLADRVR